MQTTTAVLTIHDLALQGFTPIEIARLQRLKERYHPFREYCESNVEFGRLAFLKWRYAQQVEQTTT
jgi:hypothetical protein